MQYFFVGKMQYLYYYDMVGIWKSSVKCFKLPAFKLPNLYLHSILPKLYYVLSNKSSLAYKCLSLLKALKTSSQNMNIKFLIEPYCL